MRVGQVKFYPYEKGEIFFSGLLKRVRKMFQGMFYLGPLKF